jgi:hypothetical protein
MEPRTASDTNRPWVVRAASQASVPVLGKRITTLADHATTAGVRPAPPPPAG